MPPRDNVADANRRSWGLGIVLNGNSALPRTLNHRPAASVSSADPVKSQGLLGNTTSGKSSSREEGQQQSTVYSFIHRVTRSISSFMTTEVDGGSADGRTGSKSYIEDMLESFYLSQGRPVPEWVHSPPPDPPLAEEPQSASVTDNEPAYKPASSSQQTRKEESETERSKPKSKRSSSTSGALKPFAKLNISWLSRPQNPLGPSSSSAGEEPSGSSRTRQLVSDLSASSLTSHRQTPAQASSAHDSGFNSPAPDLNVASVVPPVIVHVTDSGTTTSSSTRPCTPSTAMENLQSLSASGYSSQSANPQRYGQGKSPNIIQRSLTLDRWRRKDTAEKQRAASPISLASLLPREKTAGKSAEPGSLDDSPRAATPRSRSTRQRALGQESPWRFVSPPTPGAVPAALGKSKSHGAPSKEPSRQAWSILPIRLRRRKSDSSKREGGALEERVNSQIAQASADSEALLVPASNGEHESAKRAIPVASKVKKLFRLKGSHE